MVKNIKTQTCTTTMKKFATFTASILLLPVFAACAPNDTAQVEPTPIVTAPPVADVTPEPTTPDATANENIPEVVQANPSLKTLGSLI
ncbi:MAG: fasciclin domain-containing protein, partial [Trichormus sp.]